MHAVQHVDALGVVAAGHAAYPADEGMLVTMMEYRQPVARSNAVRFFICLRKGLVRRAIQLSSAGHPADLNQGPDRTDFLTYERITPGAVGVHAARSLSG